MRSKRGFTLIELLAVIVILAVIALIATPIIMNVINDSKEGAAKDAMYGYVKAVELASAKQITPTTDAPNGDYTTENGNLKQGSELLEITFKGTKPANNGAVTLSKGNVTSATLIFDGITVTYDGKKAEVGGSSTPTTPAKTYTIGEEVYFDPTGTVADCVSGKEWKPSNTSTTCYKWNVIKDNGNNIEMLLDHTTTADTAWITKEDYVAAGGTEAEYGTYGNNKYGPVTAMKKLKTDTSGWSKVETLTSSDNVTRANASGGTYTINYNGMKARLISGQEVADSANLTEWVPGNSSFSSLLTAPWLYQNLSNDDTATEPIGYWTDTASLSANNYVWVVFHHGNMSDILVINGYGIRPVVRVLKSNL